MRFIFSRLVRKDVAEQETHVKAKSIGIRGLRGQMFYFMVVFGCRRVRELSDTCVGQLKGSFDTFVNFLHFVMENMESRRCKEFSRVKWRRRRRTDRRGGSGGGKSVRMKVKKLQRLIPGGKGLQPDRLFLRTADYILHLRLQVNILLALSKIYQSSM
ncbi:hypothetical protein CRYUN_Cryun29cG0047400 [Craigia yunnanensis]